MRKLMCFLTLAMVLVMLIGFPIGIVQAGKCYLPDFDAGNFSSPDNNPYLPMPDPNGMGQTYVYKAETEDGPSLDFIYFPPRPTNNILGVDIYEVHDAEYLYVEELEAYVLQEDTFDYHAWDNEGNFWYFGEDTYAYSYSDDWSQCTETSTEGAWEAGVDDAAPGIILLADPHPGDCVQQESAPDVAEDMGKVLRLNAKVSTELGDYEDCEMAKEWSPLERGDIEHKYYAPDFGLVYIQELKEKTVTYELVDYYPDLPKLDLINIKEYLDCPAP